MKSASANGSEKDPASERRNAGGRSDAAPVQSLIGEALRSHYASLLEEPVPDRLLALLAELEASERKKRG